MAKKKNEIIAIGEVGLDYYWQHTKERQKKIFLQFIELAEKTKLPLIIHSRKAEDDVIPLLESTNIKVVLHAFEGKKQLIKRADEKNFKFSIPPSVVRSQHFKTLIEKVSLQNLLTETDAPFLSAVKYQRNEPSEIKYVIKKISEIKGITVEETEKIIFINFKKCFK